MKRLAGQVAWISGAASGIGAGIARLFAEEGAAVAMTDLNQEGGRALADELARADHRVRFIHGDVGHEDQVRRSINDTVEIFGALHILVNNAGIVHVKPLHEMSEVEWDHQMAVNIKSIFFSVKHAIAHLRKQQRSYVVNIGSISSFVGQRGTPAYTASKGAVLQLSRSIALDYAADGVRCNCICPGITDTPLLRYHLSRMPDPEMALAERLRRVPMNAALQPEDIARAALFFSCADSSGITGTSLIVDGGYLAAAEWDAQP